MFSGFQEVLNGTRSAGRAGRGAAGGVGEGQAAGQDPDAGVALWIAMQARNKLYAARAGRNGALAGALDRYVPPVRRQQARTTRCFSCSPACRSTWSSWLYPFLNTMYLSFTNWNGITPNKDSIGLSNYVRMIRGGGCPESVRQQHHLGDHRDDLARVPGAVRGAPRVERRPRFPPVFGPSSSSRSSFPWWSLAIVWQWIYHPLFGILNKVLDGVGLEGLSRGWLADPTPRSTRC